ncbi:MAG: KOW domain-containing RNA-binding protein [Clostridia bacterium]
MKAKPTKQGAVVVSKQGHDAGRWYAVLSVTDESHVKLCDGKIRKLTNPKNKQVKHLIALPMTIPVSGKGASGGEWADSDIRTALQAAKDAYENKTDVARRNACEHKEECAFVQE